MIGLNTFCMQHNYIVLLLLYYYCIFVTNTLRTENSNGWQIGGSKFDTFVMTDTF